MQILGMAVLSKPHQQWRLVLIDYNSESENNDDLGYDNDNDI